MVTPWTEGQNVCVAFFMALYNKQACNARWYVEKQMWDGKNITRYNFIPLHYPLGLKLHIIFIINKSTDYFLDQSIVRSIKSLIQIACSYSVSRGLEPAHF